MSQGDTPITIVARRWHEGSDHARDGSPFGGAHCNCMRIARRLTPMLFEAWDEGTTAVEAARKAGGGIISNPYFEPKNGR